MTVAIDRRKTLGDLKKMLEVEVGVTSMEFKVQICASVCVGVLTCVCVCVRMYRCIVSIATIRSMRCFGCRTLYRACPMRRGWLCG